MPIVQVPRLSWKTPIEQLNADASLWRSADLSDEAIAEFERAYPGKVRGVDPKVRAQAKAAESAKRAKAMEAALADAKRQAAADAEAATKAGVA